MYRTAINAFTHFRQRISLPNLWPAPSLHFILFISYCFTNGRAASTISTYMAGLSFYHKLHSWADPLHIFVIRKLLEGCRRSRAHLDTRAPITYSLLTKVYDILPSICATSFELVLFRTLYVLAYYGLFRVSELISTRHGGLPLQFQDVSIDSPPVSATLTLHSTKTSQSPITFRIPRPDNGPCPVTLLSHYLHIRPSQMGHLFIHRNGLPVTRYQFSSVLRHAVQSIGLPLSCYKSHSFRIGRATDLSLNGYSDSDIQCLGRWRSTAYQSYIRSHSIVTF